MRWVIDALTVLTLAALVAGVLYFHRQKGQQAALIERASADVRRMELEVKLRAVTGGAALNQDGWPETIDPAWFEHAPPRNELLDSERAWVEVAGEGQEELLHPPVRMAVNGDEAAFWYNPRLGVVRARVPMLVSDAEATALYNRINRSSLKSIHEKEKPEPVKTAATQR